MKTIHVLLAIGVFSCAMPLAAQQPTHEDLDHPQGTNLGIYTFTGRCATCHDTAKGGAPDRYTLNRHTPEEVYAKMTSGSMAPYAQDMTEFEKRVVAVYVGGRPFGSAAAGDISKMKNACASTSVNEKMRSRDWNGWGFDVGNSRFQASPGLTADQVPKLELKWAFGFPNGNSAYGQPSVVGGKVFVGSDTGFVYSIDAESGCVYWSFRASAGVRTAVSIGPGPSGGQTAYFGDIKGNVYAVNAASGAQVWKQRADTHPIARITGAPKLIDGRLYVPVASLEESGGGNPAYPCCTFRGSVVAYDAKSGKQIWKAYTVPEEARPLKKTSKGTELWGPAGAGIWSTPAVDLKRRAFYVATGNGYTDPAVDTSDAVVAFSLDTGKRLWVKQVMALDAYVRNCPGKWRPNVPTANKSETCPDTLGPDMDFGSPPILRDLSDGRTLIIAAQKDGDAWALDADKKGEIVWHRQMGLGLENGGGGMMWGSAADNDMVYFPITRAGDKLGLAAVRLANGETAWRASPAVASAAPASVIPGVIFSGASTGTMYAYSTTDGKMLWQFDTAKLFPTVNGVEATGGSLNAAGPVVAGGILFVPSGYCDLGFGVRGNVLLAFAPSAKGGSQIVSAKGVKLPEGAGKDMVQNRCRDCHGLDTIAGARLSHDQWQAEVDDMIAKGAKLSDSEFEAIVQYLAKNFGRKQ